MTTNRQCRLIARPVGIAQAEHFAIVDGASIEPADGELRVRNRFLSVEPAMRGWIADMGNYSAPVEIGSVMRSLAVGEVETSRHPDYSPGQIVCGWFGWQERATISAQQVVRIVRESDLPMSLSLGVLGINGVTALLALSKIGEPKAGETVVVSTAAGAVGSAAGQIAKILGCRTVGIAGGPDKVRSCLEDFRYDAAIDYRNGPIDAALAEACPEGVDVYYDNVAGPISDAVYRRLAVNSRVIVCGTASVPDWSDWPIGPRVERHLLRQRARMQGFVIFDHMAEYEAAIARLADWVRSGVLAYREDILDGIEACPDALAGLYRGENAGKRLIRL
ncbi:oxidoreductase, zinc-binding dehydrogenase family [Brevundimonas sp. BAL3]|uniref:NADP-dependent oxidoreductase n=1 Tax=Brevundimonas sp. BAL3 TaxID=391600 RepID=UPI00017ED828|nr:NADP-dependent oxidoreductase [Brevundimonas sp. BAL3]EDX80357.1 oxidoreductase, zinc-binding dehydrogenase family [Brevundimonas sp. BAL3]